MPETKENKFFEDVEFDEKDLTEEELLEQEEAEKLKQEQLQKNKDAEEARKRREAEEKEAKAKAEKEQAEAEEKARLEKEEAEKLAEQAKEKEEKEKKVRQENKLGAELIDFKDKYPNIDIAKLDEDENFKTFIDGKLLGKKDFTGLYEDYQKMQSSINGMSQEENSIRYQLKQESSSGGIGREQQTNPGVYSEEEMADLIKKMPLMNPNKVAEISEKFNKSIAFYEEKKKKK